jgi:hypothetical protein
MKLAQFVAEKGVTEFTFERLVLETTEQNGEKIAVLYLTKPIPMVEGSLLVGDEAVGESTERLKAYDVETIRIHQTDFEASGVEVDEKTGKGSVKTDLRLDVSGKGDVWIRSQSFAQFKRSKNLERSQNRRSGLYKVMQERKAKSQLPADVNAGQPESVASNATADAGAVKTA